MAEESPKNLAPPLMMPAPPGHLSSSEAHEWIRQYILNSTVITPETDEQLRIPEQTLKDACAAANAEAVRWGFQLAMHSAVKKTLDQIAPEATAWEVLSSVLLTTDLLDLSAEDRLIVAQEREAWTDLARQAHGQAPPVLSKFEQSVKRRKEAAKKNYEDKRTATWEARHVYRRLDCRAFPGHAPADTYQLMSEWDAQAKARRWAKQMAEAVKTQPGSLGQPSTVEGANTSPAQAALLVPGKKLEGTMEPSSKRCYRIKLKEGKKLQFQYCLWGLSGAKTAFRIAIANSLSGIVFQKCFNVAPSDEDFIKIRSHDFTAPAADSFYIQFSIGTNGGAVCYRILID